MALRPGGPLGPLRSTSTLLVVLGILLHTGSGLPTDSEEEVPSKPVNVTVLQVTDTILEMNWAEPEQPNGVIQGYRLYYMHKNFTDVKSIRNPLPQMEYVLTDLEPYTEYKIWLKAFTWKNEGESSDPVVVQTDVHGPSAPYILNLTCQSHDTLFLQWQRPATFYNSIDYYYIYYRSEDSWDFEEISVETASDRLDHMMFIPNLTANTMYEVKVRGATRSLFQKKKIYKGQFSEPRKVLVQPNCEKIQYVSIRGHDNEFSAGMIAGIVCASFALVLAIIAFILWRDLSSCKKHTEQQSFRSEHCGNRGPYLTLCNADLDQGKCFQAAYYYLDDPPRAPPPLVAVDWDIEVGPDGTKTSIPVHLFPKHVLELHADGDIGFSKEYEAIQAASSQEEYTSEHSQHPDNKQKNRYLNIVAYDHTRVQLHPLPGQKRGIDYVNANYIDGFQKYRGYIGTQGPLPSTFDCFWRMVWEQHVHIIVMITNLVERGRRKCDMYWPKEGAETYGVIQVKLVKEDVLATYTIRTLQIKHLKLKKKKHGQTERIIYQYHYTNWPDHGTPDHPLPVLSFVKKSSLANPPDAGPIIVHCSAGVGRTGTYIVLDAMLKQIRAKGELNIFGFLRHIRTQRNFLVQTEEQYIFIHDCLLEAIESGETHIDRAYLSRYLLGLQSASICGPGGEEEKIPPWKLLEAQFKLVTSFQPKDFHQPSALKACNLTKNRNLDLLPVESARVHLTPKPGIEGSDYINATWLQGFHKLREFIVTQHPLESTVQDFWQMVWDHNAQTIVMLSSVDEQEYCGFWPTEHEDMDSEYFRVKFTEEADHIGYVTRDFTVQSLQDDYELSVRLIHCPNWPHHCTPLTALFELLKLAQEWHLEYQNGPIVVMDRYGGTEAATFCCLTTLMKQLEFEHHVDIYLYAKLYHFRRPGIWRTQDDYLLLYRAMEALIATSGHPVADPEMYLNLNGHLNGYLPNVTNGNGHVVSGNGIVRVPPDGMETTAAISPVGETQA